MAARRVLFKCVSPLLSGQLRVTLYEDTWLNHILGRHSEMAAYLTEIEATVHAPSRVLVSPNNPAYYSFVNDKVTSVLSNAPLCVHVDPAFGVIASAHFNRSVRIGSPGTVVWPTP